MTPKKSCILSVKKKKKLQSINFTKNDFSHLTFSHLISTYLVKVIFPVDRYK